MQIKITGRNIEITPALRDYAIDKASKLEDYFNNIQKVEVVLETRSIDDIDKRQVAEIRAWLAGKKMIQAIEAGRDAYAAIDMVLEEAKRQVKKHKDMLVKEQRRSAGATKRELSEVEAGADEAGPGLVQLDKLAKKPMDIEEAKAELKIMDQDFLAFRNADNDEINVVRKSGKKIELLKPEKALLPNEAVEELKKTKKNLIVFKNKSSNTPSIVFRRKSGNFGLIEPEL